jgi:hypothetical protein
MTALQTQANFSEIQHENFTKSPTVFTEPVRVIGEIVGNPIEQVMEFKYISTPINSSNRLVMILQIKQASQLIRMLKQQYME